MLRLRSLGGGKMGVVSSPRAAKLAYGATFTLVLPLGLWLWNSHLRCPFPPIHSMWLGLVLLTAGTLLMVSGMWQLWSEGRGLPMNAFPPPRVVRAGVYAAVPHPIYCGFIAVCAGLAFAAGSATGLWLATPLAALGCLALVLGYESPDLRHRFGRDLPTPWLGPPAGSGSLPPLNRLGAALSVLAPWAVAYLAVKTLGVSAAAFETRLGWEWSIPVLPATMPVYATIYLVVPLTFFLCATRPQMRRLVITAWNAIILNTFLYLVVSATAAFRSVPVTDWLSGWLAWEQRLALPPAGSFPSFHVTWAVLCAASLSRGPLRRARTLCWAWCLGLCLSCLSTGMHSLADVLAGVLTGVLCDQHEDLWKRALHWVELLGNDWKAWRIGPLRIMNHCVWAGAAGFVAVLLAGVSAAPQHLGWLVLVAAITLVGAALWAQWVEGSSALLRPFGYYGSILGGLAALALVALLGGPGPDLAAAFALAAPWTQAIGRLRCIVQGCCHGRPVDWGIRIVNPHSRVVKLAGFSGTPIHPTPLYSIIANLALGFLLLRLRISGAGPFQIAGLYLVLAGMSRFVEEAYRGEPQTARFAGLPLYQWLAVGSLLLGMALMALPRCSLPPLHASSPVLLAASLAWGAVCAFCMGMDFPDSNRRFSRLTG